MRHTISGNINKSIFGNRLDLATDIANHNKKDMNSLIMSMFEKVKNKSAISKFHEIKQI